MYSYARAKEPTMSDLEYYGVAYYLPQVKEPTMSSLARGKPVYLPPRFMTVRQLPPA